MPARAATTHEGSAQRPRVQVRGGLTPWRAERVRAYVEANLAGPLSLAQLAAQARLSASRFGRAFKVSFGIPPHTFVIERRLSRARGLMLGAKAPLSQIALACGLADQAHLCRLFRRQTGWSPAAWRRANAGMQRNNQQKWGFVVQGHGRQKFTGARLIESSANRPWSLISAELRSHSVGEIGAFTPQNAEITQIVGDTNLAYSTRASGGVRQQVVAAPGTTWLCPAGICEEATRLSGDMPEVLHVFLPPHSFLGAIGETHPNFRAQDLRYQGQTAIPAIQRLTSQIVRELREETSSGGLKMDALAVELIGTLAREHAEVPSSRSPVALAKGALDRRRLSRVLDYIEANLDGEITVADLADTACFSLFHFVRAFDLAMGRTPYAYLSERRLDRAKQLLVFSEATLVEISLACCFSGQGAFTKAFRRALGVTPGRYREAVRSQR